MVSTSLKQLSFLPCVLPQTHQENCLTLLVFVKAISVFVAAMAFICKSSFLSLLRALKTNILPLASLLPVGSDELFLGPTPLGKESPLSLSQLILSGLFVSLQHTPREGPSKVFASVQPPEGSLPITHVLWIQDGKFRFTSFFKSLFCLLVFLMQCL